MSKQMAQYTAKVFYRREFAEAGDCLCERFAEQFPQAAAYVDRILKGAKQA